MVATLAAAGFKVTASDIATGLDFLSDKARSHRAHCDAIVTNPPYGFQGKEAVRFVARALELARPHRGVVAMLLKVDFDSGITRRCFFADCPAWGTKIVLMHRVLWFESKTGNTSSVNHAWHVWSWRHKGPPVILYGANLGDRGVLWRTDLEQELRSTSRSRSAATG
jgi:predicted RNA methylase